MQGIVGNVPGQAMAFLTLYLQLLGIDNFRASLLVSMGMLAHAAGGQLGGLIGDAAARQAPKWGRIFVCQVSVVAGEIAASADREHANGSLHHCAPQGPSCSDSLSHFCQPLCTCACVAR